MHKCLYYLLYSCLIMLSYIHVDEINNNNNCYYRLERTITYIISYYICCLQSSLYYSVIAVLAN